MRPVRTLLFTLGTLALLASVQRCKTVEMDEQTPTTRDTTSTTGFKCEENKTLCGQLKSCAEAKFYQANCPDVNLDADSDGTPCEELLCK